MAKSDVSVCDNMTIEDRWAELHYDLLDEIIKHVDFYDSFVRIRAVCRQWNHTLSKNPKYINNLLLVLPFDSKEEIFRPFLNISENKVYYMKLPETRNTFLRGSYYEWLITVAIDGTMRMLNPFTRVHVDLPPLSAFPNVIEYQPKMEEYTLKSSTWTQNGMLMFMDKFEMQKFYIKKLILSSQPEHVQDFMALAIYGVHSSLCYCRLGDSSWTTFQDFDIAIKDATFYEGKIYVINYKTELYEFTFDTNTRRISGGIVPVVPSSDTEVGFSQSSYVVGTPLGLLLVKRQLDLEFIIGTKNSYYYKTSGFKVYRLSRDEEKIIWLEVNSLGDYVLLVGYNTSMWMWPHTLPDEKGNRIYYTDDRYLLHFRHNFGGQDIGVFDMEDGRLNTLFPDVQQLYPAPVWLLKEVF